jgi:hypothetical protein
MLIRMVFWYMIIYLQAITSSIECRLSVTAIRMQEIPPENLKQEFIVIFDCGIRKIKSGSVGI